MKEIKEKVECVERLTKQSPSLAALYCLQLGRRGCDVEKLFCMLNKDTRDALNDYAAKKMFGCNAEVSTEELLKGAVL